MIRTIIHWGLYWGPPILEITIPCISLYPTVNPKAYLEGQGDLVSRLVTPITHLRILLIPIIVPTY